MIFGKDKGTSRFYSEQYLARYVAEFEFRHNNRSGLGATDGERTATALSSIGGQAPDVPAD